MYTCEAYKKGQTGKTLAKRTHMALQSVVKDRFLLNDLQFLTEFSHTGGLEVYHSLYNKYCPKHLHFGLDGMVARSELAIMDHNSGTECKQAKTRNRHKLVFSKVSQSWVVKKILEKRTKLILRN